MPTLLNTWLESFRSLKLLGHRAVLALIGISIGTAAIVALLDIGQSASTAVLRMFQGMGASLMVVTFPTAQSGAVSLSDVSVGFAQGGPQGLTDYAPISVNNVDARYSGHATNLSIVGATPQLSSAIGLQIISGRLLSEFDQKETFVMVGADVWKEFGVDHPVTEGDVIQLKGYLYHVIGVLKKSAEIPWVPLNANRSVFVPIEGLRRIQPKPGISAIVARSVEGRDLPVVSENLKHYLGDKLRGVDVDVRIPQQLLDAMKGQARTYSYLLAGIGAIALLVGGIGIMNVMLMNVAERRREIGIRIAIGARARDIRSMFLFEAINLSCAGAFIGVVLGTTAAFIFCRFSGWEFTFSSFAAPLGASCSIASGLFFGVYPAIVAAREKPVEALRDA